MPHLLSALLAALGVLVAAVMPAEARSLDFGTLRCWALAAKWDSADANDKITANYVLNWMAGYHAGEAHGTVYNAQDMTTAMTKTVTYCRENPNSGVLAASKGFMGSHIITSEGAGAVDLSSKTCTAILNAKGDDGERLNTLWWLAGYHASAREKNGTQIRFQDLADKMREIIAFCGDNPNLGLMIVSDKYLAE